MPTKVIVTTDPGQDEAAAIMMLLAAPESFEVLGFVATAGNIGLDHTVVNMLEILELTKPWVSGKHALHEAILGILPATNSGAPYLTTFFVGRCGKIADLEPFVTSRIHRNLQELVGRSREISHISPQKKW
jgi:hypothetical protein